MKCFAIILLVLCCGSMRAQRADFCATDFSKADSIAAHYTAHSLKDLKMLADKLCGPLPTEQEKFRAIYQWVCSNIEADYPLLMLNKHKRATLKGDKLKRWNKTFNKKIFETLVSEHKTVCTGYAYLVKELAYHAGLSCTIINGYARHSGVDSTAIGPVNHSWNKIKLNNKWYVCDATWSSGVYSLTTAQFVKRYNDQFFLTEPSVFFKTHYAMESEK